MRITLTDRLSFPVTSQRVITDNGYLQVPGRVARIGVQQYLASELGLTDRPPNQTVNVYRPPEEVFNLDSLRTYDNADITSDHPLELVNADTFKSVSVGHAISAGRQDGDFVVVDLLIKDAGAIAEINSGKSELSAGYTADYIKKKRVAPDGTNYEFIQANIEINHIALCDTARAGHKARLFDSQYKEVKQMPQVILDSGVTVEVADDATKTLIQTTLDSLKNKLKAADEATANAEKEKDTAQAKADALKEENKELKEKSSSDSINRLIGELYQTKDAALKIAGKEFSCDSVSPLEIKRKALDAAGVTCKRHASWDKAPEAYVDAFFDAELEKKESEDEDEEAEKKNAQDSLKGLAGDIKKAQSGDAGVTRDAVYEEFLKNRYSNGGKK